MKGFERKDPLFSLCGLNCGLCSMRLGGHCGGCGFGNQSCKIARCSLSHGGVEYCFLCGEYPCALYDEIDRYDSFITHQNRRADMEKARRIGPEAYGREQREKAELLKLLLDRYNDGRKKTLYCLAVNLLEVEELRGALAELESRPQLAEAGVREKAACLARLLQRLAEAKGIQLRLRKRRPVTEGDL